MRQRATKPNSQAYADYRRSALQGEDAPDLQARLLALAALVCAVAAIIGSFGPWFRSDGVFALLGAGIAAIALIVILVRQNVDHAPVVALVALGLAALASGISWVILDQRADGLAFTQPSWNASTGWGVVLTALAALAGTVCALFLFRRISRY